MKKRKVTVLSAPGGKPAGTLVQVGGMLFSSSISGVDSKTGRLSTQASEQIDAAFANLKALLGMAGATADEIGLVTICLGDERDSRQVDRAWAALYPDERNRPARKINEYSLPPGERVQLQIVGEKATIALEVFGQRVVSRSPAGARISPGRGSCGSRCSATGARPQRQ